MTKHPDFSVTWPVSANLDLFHFSKLISGLSELQSRGKIAVRLTEHRPPELAHGTIAWWDVRETATQRTRRIAIEVADSGSFVDTLSAEHCDVYFKRSYQTDVIEKARLAFPRCVFLPLGLNHACLGRGGLPLYFLLAARRFIALLKRRQGVPHAIRRLIGDIRIAGGLPVPQAFENDTSADRARVALFQTRVWPLESSTDSLELLNHERASLVRALRRGLGSEYVGGVVADSFSLADCPDVATEENLRRSSYAKMSRRALIGIYSRGIHHSLAFKLAEYLASGLCIVSTPLLHELPAPLVPGRHFLLYESEDECVQAARWLLAHETDREKMCRANREYYQLYVAPEPYVSNLLRRAFHSSADRVPP